MFVSAVCAQIITSSVRRSTYWTHKPAREMNMVMVTNVCYHFAAQLAPVKIGETWQPVEC